MADPDLKQAEEQLEDYLRRRAKEPTPTTGYLPRKAPRAASTRRRSIAPPRGRRRSRNYRRRDVWLLSGERGNSLTPVGAIGEPATELGNPLHSAGRPVGASKSA